MKKNKRILLVTIWLLVSIGSYGQELKVEAFQRMDRDLLARTNERKDLNGVPCAIVRVSVAGSRKFFFEGNVIGDVVYKPGEAWVYMTDKSRNLTITSDKFGSMKYEFPQRLEQQVVYKLSLKLIQNEDNKIRTLVMPVVGVGNVTSYGAMIGVVKKTGAYLKVKYNFKGQDADFECDGDGYIAETGEKPWYTGEKTSSRFAITGGLLQRLAKPLYLYVGAGYGFKKVAWETQDEQWAENTDDTYDGVEVDLGGILRIKNFAFSAGVQTNQFKYWEATLGLGIMF